MTDKQPISGQVNNNSDTYLYDCILGLLFIGYMGLNSFIQTRKFSSLLNR